MENGSTIGIVLMVVFVAAGFLLRGLTGGTTKPETGKGGGGKPEDEKDDDIHDTPPH